MEGCALGITRRGETTHSGVDVNNTHPSMINPLNNALPHWLDANLESVLQSNYSQRLR